jgi:hypothetical protein
MTDDDVWNRLAALLPEAEAEEVGECRSIGEQEAALGLLVSGILTHRRAISETVRARLSVLAEDWGEREALTPGILRCRTDGEATAVKLLEDDGSTLDGATLDGSTVDGSTVDGAPVRGEPALADLVLVPWIVCTRCGRVLMRAHDRESWGGLSCLARRYVITAPDRVTVVQSFAAESVGDAFDSLLRKCSAPSD